MLYEPLKKIKLYSQPLKSGMGDFVLVAGKKHFKKKGQKIIFAKNTFKDSSRI